MHRGGSIFWKSPGCGYYHSPLGVYAQSKLALTMFTKSLAEASGPAFTAISVHPGVFQTGLLPFYGRDEWPTG